MIYTKQNTVSSISNRTIFSNILDDFTIDDGKQKSMDVEPSESICPSVEELTDICANTSSLSASDDFCMPTLNYMSSVTHIQSADIQGSLRVCLHGEGETANVTFNPDTIQLGCLEMKKTVERSVLMFNSSEVLPIIYRYKKVPFVEVTPKQGYIPPEEGNEILVRITPAKNGAVKTKIDFELLYYNFPRKEEEYVIVGEDGVVLEFEVPFTKAVSKPKVRKGTCGNRNLPTEEIRFSTNVDIPKCIMPVNARNKRSQDNAFIAFPDDRPAALRPWRRTEA